MKLFAEACQRCGLSLADGVPHTGSYFDRATICLECRSDERTCPNYEAAVVAEQSAFMAGQRDYRGIGLAPEDRDHLDRLRQRRHSGASP